MPRHYPNTEVVRCIHIVEIIYRFNVEDYSLSGAYFY